MPLNPQKIRSFHFFSCPRTTICPRFVHEKNIRGQIYVYLYYLYNEGTLFLNCFRSRQTLWPEPAIYSQFFFILECLNGRCIRMMYRSDRISPNTACCRSADMCVTLAHRFMRLSASVFHSPASGSYIFPPAHTKKTGVSYLTETSPALLYCFSHSMSG